MLYTMVFWDKLFLTCVFQLDTPVIEVDEFAFAVTKNIDILVILKLLSFGTIHFTEGYFFTENLLNRIESYSFMLTIKGFT